MISTEIHPADSSEFLSRLHDGDLEPAEAAAFESHRAECADCRASVAAFERALSAYREAPVPPASSDLSARILKKIRATSPSRRPFGVTFGIDVRWAGVLAAALLVLIIGAPVFSRHPFGRTPQAAPPRTEASPSEAISAYLVDARRKSSGPPMRSLPRRPPRPSSTPLPKSAPASGRAASRGSRERGRSRPSRPLRPPPRAREEAKARPDAAGKRRAGGAREPTPIRVLPGSLPRRTRRACGRRRRTSASRPPGGEAGLAGGAEETCPAYA